VNLVQVAQRIVAVVLVGMIMIVTVVIHAVALLGTALVMIIGVGLLQQNLSVTPVADIGIRIQRALVVQMVLVMMMGMVILSVMDIINFYSQEKKGGGDVSLFLFHCNPGTIVYDAIYYIKKNQIFLQGCFPKHCALPSKFLLIQ